MTTDPTPEQLKALAYSVERLGTSGATISQETLLEAAHHLRAYAEQIEIQERKSSLESECLQGQLTDRDARIKELEISNHNWEVHGKRLQAQVKELEACCAEMRSVLEDCFKHRHFDNHSSCSCPEDALRAISTNCGKDLLAQVDRLKRAAAALNGRLGKEPDAVVWACEAYVAAEDQLPDRFDTEDYTLSKAVESLVESESRLLAQHETKAKALEAQLFGVKSSMQICVGAARIGDPSELCGWIDNIKAQHELWRVALEIIASGPETHEATILARQALKGEK